MTQYMLGLAVYARESTRQTRRRHRHSARSDVVIPHHDATAGSAIVFVDGRKNEGEAQEEERGEEIQMGERESFRW